MKRDENYDVDILAIGAGACGLAAAIAAHDAGASVAIVEKRERPGGNSLSTGSVPGAGTRFQRDAGIDDSPERMVADLMAIAGDTEDAALLRRMAEVSAPTVEWLIDHVGARMTLITAYKHIGHSERRLHAPRSRRGQDLVDDLLAAIAGRDIPLALGNAVEELIVENGAVQGAVVRSSEGASRVRARKTILAVNGFAADRDLVARWCPEIAGAQYFGAPGSHGEAVRWGEALGAGLANMGAYQGYAAVAYPHGALLSWTTIEKGGFLVGDDGRRFGDESLGYSGFARRVLEQGEFATAIFDQRIFEIAALEEEFMELVQYGGVKRFDDPDTLAAAFSLDPASLGQTIEAFQRAAQGEADDAFGRRDFGLGPLAPPYWACRVTPGLFHTQGGLRVDADGRVLDVSGEPIANLFAGGGAAAGISGAKGALGYASGNGLLTAIALGRLAGLAAAREIAQALHGQRNVTLSRRLVLAWMAQASRDIPDEVVEAARLHLLDVTGVGLAAATLSQGAPYRRFARSMRAERGLATLTGETVADAGAAALVDGGLIHALEYDDTHTASIVHGGAVVAPAALAVARQVGASPARALRAYLLGYEAFIRLGLAAPGAFQRNGFQVTSVAGPLVAALIAADLMDADADARIHAVGVALSQSSGVFEFLTNGSTVKSLHPGWAAQAGILAARLACAGMTGPETAIEGARGLYGCFARDADAPARFGELLSDFGARWRIADVAFKFAPCCHYLHPFIEAAGDLARTIPADAIDRLELRIARGAAPIVCEPWADKLAPSDGHAMRWSLPLVVAARLVEGRVDHETFAHAPSPDLHALAARCRWTPLESDRFPEAFEAQIVCVSKDGRRETRRIDDVYGNVGRPAARSDVIGKFRANAARALDDDAVDRLQTFFLDEQRRDFAFYDRALATQRNGDHR